MAKNYLNDYSTTAGSNTDIGGIDVNEGCAPSGINDAIRELMSHLAGLNAELDVGADIASATALLVDVPGVAHDVTGTTTITSFAAATNDTSRVKILQFDGILTLTHHATNLVLLTGANRTTAAGDIGIYYQYGAGTWREVYFSGGGNATTALDNLASVAINTSLISDTDSTDDLGDSTTPKRWANVYTDAIGDTGQSLEVKSSDLKISDGVILLKEQAEADADQAGYGQIWVNTATPNELWFTDDAGTDTQLNVSAGITLGTEQASTSGTAIDFTGIPAGTKRITIMFVGVSTSSTSAPTVQLGDSGGIEATGYEGSVGSHSSSTDFSTGFDLAFGHAGSSTLNGSLILSLEDSSDFTWVAQGIISLGNASGGYFTSGSKPLSAELTQVRITTLNGTDTFDAGAINISYE